MDLKTFAETYGDVEVRPVYLLVMLIAAAHLIALCLWAHVNLRAPDDPVADDLRKMFDVRDDPPTTRLRRRPAATPAARANQQQQQAGTLRQRLAARRAERAKAKAETREKAA